MHGYTIEEINTFINDLARNYNALNESIIRLWRGDLITSMRPVWKATEEQSFEIAIAKKLVKISSALAEVTNNTQKTALRLFKAWVEFQNSIKVQGVKAKATISANAVKLNPVTGFAFASVAPEPVSYSDSDTMGLTPETETVVVQKIDKFVSDLSDMINGFKHGLNARQPFKGSQKDAFDSYVNSCQDVMSRIIGVTGTFKSDFNAIKSAYEQADVDVSKILNNAHSEGTTSEELSDKWSAE